LFVFIAKFKGIKQLASKTDDHLNAEDLNKIIKEEVSTFKIDANNSGFTQFSEAEIKFLMDRSTEAYLEDGDHNEKIKVAAQNFV
jgi:hypothetical protein